MKTKVKVYYEHEKLKTLNNKNQVCGDFLEWLNEKEYVVCEGHEHTSYCYDKGGDSICDYEEGDMLPIRINIENLLADYFGINTNKLEKEKGDMLKDIRRHNAKQK